MKQSTIHTAKLSLVFSMLVFGSIGIFVRHVPLPSSVIALVRGTIGTLFLLGFSRLRKAPVCWAVIRKNLGLLILSGAFIGFNWILLFEAYRYTTVATATLCYYLAPVFVILATPVLFREKLTLRKGICVAVALIGMVFVSGVTQTSLSGSRDVWGILLGVSAAVLYAGGVLINKVLTDVTAFDRTIVQLGSAALSIVPYVLVTEWGTPMDWSGATIPLLLVMGIVHTGICYALYFVGIKELPTQTSALLSYIDPVSAIILSAIFLREGLTPSGLVGAVLILGATLCSELLPERNKK